MPILALSTEEAVILSAIAKTEPNKISPMQKLYLLSQFAFDEKAFTKSVPSFLDKQLILIDKEEKLHLSRELEPVFWTLNKPHEVVSLSRKSSPDTKETILCRNGNLWIQQITGITEDVEIISYPYNLEALIKWFSNDFLNGIHFNSSMAAFPASCFEISSQGVYLLLAMQQIYRDRVIKNIELHEDALWISQDDLRSATVIDGFYNLGGTMIEPNKMLGFLNESKNLENAKNLLLSKELLVREGGKIAFSALAKKLFDPGRLQDLILFKHTKDIISYKTVNVMDGGFVVFEQSGEDSNGTVWLKSIPATVDYEQLFHTLQNPLEGSESFSYELKTEPETIYDISNASVKQESNVLSEKKYFYLYNNEHQGPYTIMEIKNIGVNSETLIWYDGMDDWKKASELPEFQSVL